MQAGEPEAVAHMRKAMPHRQSADQELAAMKQANRRGLGKPGGRRCAHLGQAAWRSALAEVCLGRSHRLAVRLAVSDARWWMWIPDVFTGEASFVGDKRVHRGGEGGGEVLRA